MRRRNAVFALAMLAASARVDAQPPSSPLVLLAGAGDYPGETYTAGPAPPAEFVYFEGEALAIDVTVANWGSRREVMRLPSSRLPAVRAGVWSGDQLVRHATLTETMWRDVLGGAEPLLPSATVVIEPGDGVRWRLMLETGGLPPGFYIVRVESDGDGEAGEPIRRQRPEFTVEMRAREQALPAELARRTAEWLTAAGDGVKARAATETLARVYPDSVAVHLIRSRIADAEGNEALARRELDVAAGFMRTDRDTLFRRFARPGQIEDLIDSLGP